MSEILVVYTHIYSYKERHFTWMSIQRDHILIVFNKMCSSNVLNLSSLIYYYRTSICIAYQLPAYAKHHIITHNVTQLIAILRYQLA